MLCHLVGAKAALVEEFPTLARLEDAAVAVMGSGVLADCKLTGMAAYRLCKAQSNG